MARHLTPADIEAILDVIKGFDRDKITWGDIENASEEVTGHKPTRQTLSSIESIKEAYHAKKAALKLKVPVKPKPSSLSIAADRIARLQSEVEILKRKNDALLEQFVVWQYNAYKYGVNERQLNEPLPRIDRERSD